jgi:predicted transcriptional regulator
MHRVRGCEAGNQHQPAGDQPIQRCALRSSGQHGVKRLRLQRRFWRKARFPGRLRPVAKAFGKTGAKRETAIQTAGKG